MEGALGAWEVLQCTLKMVVEDLDLLEVRVWVK
jgi:hypothetical protein